MTPSACPGCGAVLPDAQGPTHRYMLSSPACWATYGEVLAREYRDPAYHAVHRLTVDTYAVQHPGLPTPQSIQSVGVHLVSLCAILELGMSFDAATRLIGRATQRKDRLFWLTPPPSAGAVTVLDVSHAASADAHARLVQAWAHAAWSAWAPHHETVRRWMVDALNAT